MDHQEPYAGSADSARCDSANCATRRVFPLSVRPTKVGTGAPQSTPWMPNSLFSDRIQEGLLRQRECTIDRRSRSCRRSKR